MAFHCNPMAFNFRIPSFVVAFLRVYRWVVHYASMQFRHLLSSVRRILKRGGLVWKIEKCANDLDSNFHWSWMSRKARKFKAFFCPKSGDLQKKKRSSPKFKAFFCPKSGDLQIKKKRSLLKVRPVFHPNSMPDAQLTKGGGPCLNFAHFTMQFCNPSDPKGGGMAQWPPPLNTPLHLLYTQ